MKKVLIITYYWPPAGGGGVYRWVRMVRHLRAYGWEPVVYTAENADYALQDPSLEATLPEGLTVLKQPIREPASLLQALSGGKKDKPKAENLNVRLMDERTNKKSLAARLLWWVRANVFVPDARFLWIGPSTRYLKSWLKENPVDALVSTGPPHSLHVIGKRLHQATGIPWLADFRDPWTTMDYYQEMPIGRRADRKHRRLEKAVVTGANQLVVVGNAMAREFEEMYQAPSAIVHNGYDALAKAPDGPTPLDEQFTLTHIGALQRNRNMPELWEALGQLVKENEALAQRLHIKLIGTVDAAVDEALAQHGLSGYVEKPGYMPFEETQPHLFGAQLLLLPINRVPNAAFVVTGKLFEYLKSSRPILIIGPSQGDAAAIVAQCQAGFVADYDDVAACRKIINERFALYQEGRNHVNASGAENFSAQNLTGKMAALLNAITETTETTETKK